MKFLFDTFPIILFFLAFKITGDIYTATAIAMAATVVQIGWTWQTTRKIPPMQWTSLVVILILGSATLIFHDEVFIKWKPTVLYWFFAGTLTLASVVFKKNLLRSMLDAQIELPDPAWRALQWSWVGFFSVMGVLNLWVAESFSTDAWVNFKLFGGLGLLVLFGIAQGLMLSKYVDGPPHHLNHNDSNDSNDDAK